jgi:hypothetical protein
MKQPVHVHKIATDKSDLVLAQNTNKLLLRSSDFLLIEADVDFINGKYQHLYFTTGTKIEVEDWVLDHIRNQYYKVATWQLDLIQKAKRENNCSVRKIAATTNSELWYKERYNVKNAFSGIGVIPDSFITAYISAYNADKPITQVMLEYEENTSCAHIHIPGENLPYQPFLLKLNTNGSVIWSLKEEKMYTRKEVRNGCIKALANCKHLKLISQIGEFDKWFDKNYPQ